jgi:hypothetical protein
LTLSGTNKLNGLYIIDEYLNPSISVFATVWLSSATLTYDIENCTIWENAKLITAPAVYPSAGWCIGNNTNSGGINIKYCALKYWRGVVLTSASKANLENNIYINTSNFSVDDTASLVTSGAVTIYSTPTAVQNLVIDRCIYSGFIGGKNNESFTDARFSYFPPNINIYGSAAGVTPTQQSITINSTHVFNSDNFVLINDQTYANRNKADITFLRLLYPSIQTLQRCPQILRGQLTIQSIRQHHRYFMMNTMQSTEI